MASNVVEFSKTLHELKLRALACGFEITAIGVDNPAQVVDQARELFEDDPTLRDPRKQLRSLMCGIPMRQADPETE